MGAADRGRVEKMLEIGSSLREARSGRGLELPEVEAATMIRARYLEAIEEERFELLPAGAYRRSFVREYASFLGLDPDVYASEYDLRFALAEPEPPRPRPGRSGPLDGLPLVRILAVGAAVVLVGVAVWRLNGSATHGPTALVPPAAPRPVVHHRPRPPAPATTAQARPAPPSPLALTAVRGPCWLSVRIGSSTGATIFERTLQQGGTVRFGLGKPLWIRAGAPWNLDAAIGRRPVTSSLPPHTGDLLATRSGLRPAA
jgi:hypothetical protein